MALACFGCASQAPVDKPATPATPEPTAAHAAPSTAATAATATPVAKATDAAAAADAASADSQVPNVPHGYHVIDRDGQKFYCTDTPALGTRIKSRVTCMSADQFARAQQEAKDKMREKQGQRLIQGQ